MRQLWTGLMAPPTDRARDSMHCPLIAIEPRPWDSIDIAAALTVWPRYSHLLLTSKQATRLLLDYLPRYGWHSDSLADKLVCAVGAATAAALPSGCRPLLADEATAEGLCRLVDALPQRGDALFLWPHAARARTLLADHLIQHSLALHQCILYDTVTRRPPLLPPLSRFDEIVFCSPSCVDAFVELYGALPSDKRLTAIGPITQARLLQTAPTPDNHGCNIL